MKIALRNKKTLLIFLALLCFLLSSCTIINVLETGTVTITVDENLIMGKITFSKDYYIYIDNIFRGMVIDYAPLTLENVSVGMHTFRASDHLIEPDSINLISEEISDKEIKIDILPPGCSGTINSYVTTGVNYISIPVYCGGVIL